MGARRWVESTSIADCLRAWPFARLPYMLLSPRDLIEPLGRRAQLAFNEQPATFYFSRCRRPLAYFSMGTPTREPYSTHDPS